MKFLSIHIFDEKKWNSNAYLSYHQYHEILQIFMNELVFTLGKFWGTFSCFTVLKTQDYDHMKLLFNCKCHEKIQSTKFETPNFQHFLVDFLHCIYKHFYIRLVAEFQQKNVENLDFQNLEIKSFHGIYDWTKVSFGHSLAFSRP